MSEMVEAVEHLKVLKAWFEAKRDVFNGVSCADMEINGRRIRDMNQSLWSGFLEELEPALAALLGFLEIKGVIYTELME